MMMMMIISIIIMIIIIMIIIVIIIINIIIIIIKTKYLYTTESLLGHERRNSIGGETSDISIERAPPSSGKKWLCQ